MSGNHDSIYRSARKAMVTGKGGDVWVWVGLLLLAAVVKTLLFG